MLVSVLALLLHCGSERWAIKTMVDKQATRVNQNPITISVGEAASWKAPTYHENNLRAPVELHTYVVIGYITDWIYENDDDIHLVVKDEHSIKTFIAESPSEECIEGSKFSGQMRLARRQLERILAKYGSPDLAPLIKVKIIGVGFFDKCHGQTGKAPNCFELHPILWIEEIIDDTNE